MCVVLHTLWTQRLPSSGTQSPPLVCLAQVSPLSGASRGGHDTVHAADGGRHRAVRQPPVRRGHTDAWCVSPPRPRPAGVTDCFLESGNCQVGCHER